MSKETWIVIGILVVAFIIVDIVGNKIVNKCSDAIRNRGTRKDGQQEPSQSESLADRFKTKE